MDTPQHTKVVPFKRLDWALYLAGFGAVLVLFYELYLGVPYAAHWIQRRDPGQSFLIIWFEYLILFLFFRAALDASSWFRLLCWLVFSLATIFEYNYFLSLGRFISEADFALFTSTSGELALFAYKLFFNFASVIPSLVFAGCLLVLPKKEHC